MQPKLISTYNDIYSTIKVWEYKDFSGLKKTYETVHPITGASSTKLKNF